MSAIDHTETVTRIMSNGLEAYPSSFYFQAAIELVAEDNPSAMPIEWHIEIVRELENLGVPIEEMSTIDRASCFKGMQVGAYIAKGELELRNV